MTRIICKEDREIQLLNLGMPLAFLKSIGNTLELKSRVEDVDGAYFYLPGIINYEILKDKYVVPIYSSGESFYMILYDEKTQNIIHFELENDQVYEDYSNNWELLLMDIMIVYFDDHIDDELSIEDFISLGNKIGFEKSKDLFQFRNIPIEDYYIKSEKAKEWRNEIAKGLKIL
ncbi:hypothetical protein [Pedobacter miscanthi]|jgi:hypothetical protein|uniref:hypothetical protein n=1 Tax=Pedobacter miscanthi TaxID=2259170 RepID=UPI00293022AA|nr:hypothetical protein [Pedobacter miscanthi]